MTRVHFWRQNFIDNKNKLTIQIIQEVLSDKLLIFLGISGFKLTRAIRLKRYREAVLFNPDGSHFMLNHVRSLGANFL